MHYYTDIITKKYAVFSGRARRKEYWMFGLANGAVQIVAGLFLSLVNLGETALSFVFVLYGLFILMPSLAITVRRLHDTGRSGWWLLLVLIPIIGSIVLILFMVLDSEPGSNAYGPNPKTGEATEAAA